MTQYKNSKSSIALPFIVAITLAGGILIGANVVNTVQYSQDLNKSLLKFREIVNLVNNRYVDEVDAEELIEVAIEEMLKELDPHTNYITGEELAISRSNLQGGFEGIGIEFGIIKDTLRVILPIKGGPSEKAGLMTGDKIIAINHENIAGIGLSSKGVFEKLRGDKGSKVDLDIIRLKKKKPVHVEIIRDKISQNSVEVAYMIDKETGFIKVSRFSANTYTEFKVALQQLIDAGAKRLMLDLTDNPGGYLDRAVDIIDEFIAGDSMIVYTEGKKKSYNKAHRAHRDGLFEKGALIVLIDEGSASASEIVSGALQDNDRALIVGRRSFGKGLVQMPIDLSDGSELRLTISRYYTPSGRSIQKDYAPGERANYGKDISDRYESGELFSADSIKYDDSLQFKTANGRMVYGGGGISPDYFVPIDTNTLVSSLFRTNTIREFLIDYYAANKSFVDKMGIKDFTRNFRISDKMRHSFLNLAKANGVTYTRDELKKSLALIDLHLKARLARLAFGNEGFYPIYNETSEIFQAAKALFSEAEELAYKGL